MSKLNNLFRLLNHLSDARDIRQNEAERASSKKFGIYSIVYAIIAVPLCLLAFFSVKWLNNNSLALLLIFLIATLAIGALGAVIMLFVAFFYFALQLYINRGAFTWIALATTLASLAACVLIVLLIFGIL